MNIPKVRKGNWVKTDEGGYVNVDHIIEVELKYQGRETRQDDDYEVVIMLPVTDFWLPNSEDKEIAKKHDNFFNQMSDQQHRDIFRGKKVECEQVIEQILAPKV